MKGNVLRIRSIPPKSPWRDKDDVMLHACFQLLVDFVEKEKPQTIVDYKHDKAQAAQWAEIQALYRYWTVERKREERAIDRMRAAWYREYRYKSLPDPAGRTFPTQAVSKNGPRPFTALTRREDAFQALEDEMFLRLMEVRKHLWC